MPTYRYLNLAEEWPGFARDGLEITRDGALRLARLPALDAVADAVIAPVPGFVGPMRIGIDAMGNLYVPDPAAHRILRIDGCDGTVEPLACLRGPGREPGQLLRPQGVAVGRRNALYIADTGNSRIQVVELETGQIVGLWSDPALLRSPVDLAADRAGRIYVADRGQHSRRLDRWRYGIVHRFRADGRLDVKFADTIAQQPVRPRNPVAVTIARWARGRGPREQLMVLDARPRRILVYDLNGRYNQPATRRWSRVLAAAQTPVSLAVDANIVYVADAARGRVLMFDATGSFLGLANRTPAAVAGIAFDCTGNLVVHPGSGGQVLRGAPGRFAECGSFLAGPYEATSEPTEWQRLHVELDEIPDGTHVRLLTLTSNTLDGLGGRVPEPPLCDDEGTLDIVGADVVADAALDRWREAPWDADDFLLHHRPGTYLWVAGVLRGAGDATPVIRQIRLDHDEESWMRYLPAIYRRDAAANVFMQRAFALFDAALEEQDERIDRLPEHFDAFAADDDWLEWLAGWVEADALEAWPEQKRRAGIASAFRVHASRGTLEGLRRTIALHTGATPRIEEAGLQAAPWSLGRTSALGLGTALSTASTDGAIAGTAIADASHLKPAEDFGASVFEPAAHHFRVSIYAAELQGADAEPLLRELLEREKPAHTTCDLCLIDARMSVGYQARVGVDSIVAGPPAAGQLAQTFELGHSSYTDGATSRRDPILGAGARIGVHATLA